MNNLTIIFISLMLTCTNSFAGSEKFNPNTLKMLELFGDIFEKVKRDYVTEINEKEVIESAINGMLSSLDPHSGYLDEKSFEDMKVHTKGEFGGIGLELTMENGIIKVISAIDDTPAYKENIKTNDYIIAVNDEPILGMNLTDAVKKIRGKIGTKVTLTVIKEGKSEPVEVSLNREAIKIKPVHSRAENDIAYVRINNFSETTSDDVDSELTLLKGKMGKNFKGLVLDLRNNPGGLLDQAIAVSDMFIENGEIVSTRGRTKDSIIRYNASEGDVIKGVPIAVLINSGSASAAEIVAGALQDNGRAIILGTKSFGKASVQTVMPLSNNAAIRLTTARYYTPSGRSIQAEGIVPDIEVEQAKIEFSEVNEKKLYLEANLKGHLVNDNKADEKHAKSIKEEKIKSSIKIINKVAEDNKSLAKDYQLSRAVDLLRGLAILKKD